MPFGFHTCTLEALLRKAPKKVITKVAPGKAPVRVNLKVVLFL